MEFLFVKPSIVCAGRNAEQTEQEWARAAFQAVGIVLDPPNAEGTGAQLLPAVVDYFKLTYPLGYATKDNVDRLPGP